MRIDAAFRTEMEQSLLAGESLAALVEQAVRREIERRKSQTEFVLRGISAIQRTTTAGDGIPASALLSSLEKKLAAARIQRA